MDAGVLSVSMGFSSAMTSGESTSYSSRGNAATHSGPRVRDLMTEKVFCVYRDDTVKFLCDLMKWQRIRHVPVVGKDHHLVGLVSYRDLLEEMASQWGNQLSSWPGWGSEGDDPLVDRREDLGRDLAAHVYRETPVERIMRRNIKAVGPEVPLSLAAELIFTSKIGCLPVVESDSLVGILTEGDFVRSFYQWDVSFV